MSQDRDLRDPGQRFGERLGRRTSSETLRHKVIAAEQATMTSAWQGLHDQHSVIASAGHIVAARRRFVTGTGKSYALAHLLATDLSVALAQVQLIDASSEVSLLTDVRASDVLISIGLRRYRPETATLAQLFAERGGRVLAITDSQSSPLAEIADDAIIVPTTSASHVDSVTAVVSACHLLTTLTAASAKGARRRIADRELINDQLRLYTKE